MATIKKTTFIKNCFLMSCIMGTSDSICQKLESQKNLKPWNAQRSLNMAMVGLFGTGILTQLQHILLDKFFPGVLFKQVAIKVCLGQLSMPIHIAFNFTFVAVLDHQNYHYIKQKISNDLLTTCKTGLFYWPPVQAINFKYIPLDKRAQLNSVAGFFWSIYMSQQSNKQVNKK